MKISPIEVTYRSHMGSDLDVVNAARVSFAKESEWEYNKAWGCVTDETFPVLSEKDEKLIKYLAEHNHWSPFSHCFISFHVKAPIFIARQLQKHTVGLAWNEVSRRYVDDEPEFYFPEYWRKRADNVKQGSSDEEVHSLHGVVTTSAYNGDVILGSEEDDAPTEFCSIALDLYNDMLKGEVAPEQARMILPQNTMTEFIWSGSLYAFARVVNLRTASGAQREAGEVATGIREALQALFPVSSKYLIGDK
jgi:thymidylate synthase (FAD)